MIADTIIMNGCVITVNANDDIVQAVAVKDGKIISVGTNDEIKNLIGRMTTVIDAKGKTVMPGFIDAHIHFGMYGMLGKGIINVENTLAPTIDDIKNLIKEDVVKKKKGEWIKLQGYDNNKIADKRHPTIDDLDEVAPNNPVQCIRACAHMGIYNTMALKLGGVEKPSQFEEGEVEVNNDGKLTGLLRETAHMYMSTKVEFTDDEIIEGLKNANKEMVSLGITSIHDAGCYGAPSFSNMQWASEQGLVDVRMSPMIFDMLGKDTSVKLINSFINSGVYSGLGTEKYRIGPIKIMIDGSASGPTSACSEPYSHDKNLKGILTWQPDEINEIIMRSHKAGFQVTAHAIGDYAVEMIVNAIEKALTAYPRKDHRHRIEHAAVTNPELISKIAVLGIIPVTNPAFITINGFDYKHIYGEERAKYMLPMKSYIENKVITSIGSDAPVTHPNPMNGLYGAITRQDKKRASVVGENQKVDMMQAIRMYTFNGAYTSFEESIKGSLEVGKLADIIVLSDDLLQCLPEDLENIKVKYTMIGGKICYKGQ